MLIYPQGVSHLGYPWGKDQAPESQLGPDREPVPSDVPLLSHFPSLGMHAGLQAGVNGEGGGHLTAGPGGQVPGCKEAIAHKNLVMSC